MGKNKESFDSRQMFQRIFRDRIIDPATECWLWPHGKSRGYPALWFQYHGKHVRWSLHRIVAWLYLGYDGSPVLNVCHRCNVKMCLNPAHLYLATNEQNVRDAWRDGLTPREEDRKQAKLTRARVRDIKLRLRAGETRKSIADSHGVHPGTIQAIENGKTWKTVTIDDDLH